MTSVSFLLSCSQKRRQYTATYGCTRLYNSLMNLTFAILCIMLCISVYIAIYLPTVTYTNHDIYALGLWRDT